MKCAVKWKLKKQLAKDLELYWVRRILGKAECLFSRWRGRASLNSTWCLCRWTLRYSLLPMPGEERHGGQVCSQWWNLWMLWTCLETVRTSNVGKSFLSFDTFKTKWHGLLCIFLYSHLLVFSNLYRSFCFSVDHALFTRYITVDNAH